MQTWLKILGMRLVKSQNSLYLKKTFGRVDAVYRIWMYIYSVSIIFYVNICE